jgi:2-polyprenyl-3-methyl-5-hydroxy-6-metoxy-1,4-benzoquinol methylase
MEKLSNHTEKSVEYGPVKARFSRLIRRRPLFRRIFYRLLGLVLLREWYVKRELRRMAREDRGEMVILDAGAGFGQYSYYCLRRFPGAAVESLDIQKGHVEDGRDFIRKTGESRWSFEQKDITRLDAAGRYHLILTIDVLEHIPEDVALLRRFANSLKSGGRLIVSTPTIYRKHAVDSGFVGEHVREGYSEEELREKLERAGFALSRIVYGYGIWGDLSWRLGIRNTMHLAGLGKVRRLLAPLYFILVFPLVLQLMILDYFWPNRRGTGVVAVAVLPEGDA